MSVKREYIAGKKLVMVDIKTFTRETGLFGWIAFDGIFLHQRDDGFYYDSEEKYEKLPADSELMARLIERLIPEELKPDECQVSGECQVFSAGALNDIGFEVFATKPFDEETLKSEIVTIVGRTLIDYNLAIKFV